MELFVVEPWMLMPAIFLARVADVSFGTFRSILVVRGHRVLAVDRLPEALAAATDDSRPGP